MDEERIDFTALDPWNDPERLRDLSQAIVEAHHAPPRRVPFSALLSALAPRALLAAALATLLMWGVPSLLVQRHPPANAPSTASMALLLERGRIPTGLELLQIAEVSHDK